MKKLILFMVVAVLFGPMVIRAGACTHPCIPNTLEELDSIKASLNQEP